MLPCRVSPGDIEMQFLRKKKLLRTGPGARDSGDVLNAPSAFLLPPSSCRGFTLIELLVAVAVFAIMAAVAYGGLTSVLDARGHTREVAARLADLQLAVSLMSQDLQQSVPRGIRDAYGEPLPALMGARRRVELTRAGHANPTGLKRARLQRVAWSVEHGELVRWSWQVLDRARNNAPERRDLLQGVDALHWRYFAQGAWFEAWPPLSNAPPTQQNWPEAVEFTLVLEDGGTVTRLIPLVVHP